MPARFIDEQDENRYMWMRRFADEAEREALYAAVYESEEWLNEVSPPISDMINRETIKVMRLVPTEKSVMQ